MLQGTGGDNLSRFGSSLTRAALQGSKSIASGLWAQVDLSAWNLPYFDFQQSAPQNMYCDHVSAPKHCAFPILHCIPVVHILKYRALCIMYCLFCTINQLLLVSLASTYKRLSESVQEKSLFSKSMPACIRAGPLMPYCNIINAS